MTEWRTRTYPESLDHSNVYTREYVWRFDGREFTWKLSLPKALYRARRRRTRIYDYGAYTADSWTQRTLEDFHDAIERNSSSLGWNRFDTARYVTRFVQSLEYTPDDISTDYDNYPRYPIETLVDETGDCEDASILLASLLQGLGYTVGLLEFDRHLAVGVVLADGPTNVTFDGTGYAYIETTGDGWEPGELPDRYESQSATLHRMTDSPVLHAAWKAQPDGSALECSGYVENTGAGVATDVLFRLRPDTETITRSTTVQREWDRLEPGEEVWWTGTLDLDADPTLDLKWRLAIDQIIRDEGVVASTPA